MRLFTENGTTTEEGAKIDWEVQQLLENYMRQFPDVDMRDLSLIVLGAAHGATLAMILGRRRK